MKSFFDDIKQGLLSTPKSLPSKYFYDAAGDEIFRRLMNSEEYYLSRCELEILKVKAPGASERLSRQVVGFVQKVRGMDLFKLPGIAETIDWAESLIQLNKVALDPAAIDDTLGVLLKYQDDIAKIEGSEAARLLEEVKREVALGGAGSAG